MTTHRLILFLSFSFLVAESSFAQTLWTAGTADWSDAGNWSLGVPMAFTDAQIDNAGQAQIVAPGAAANNVTLGTAASSSGSLAVPGGHAQLSSDLAVGAFGNGALTITGGGSVLNTNGRVGRELGGSGTVTIAGPGSLWRNNGDLTVGSASGGVGALTIEDQATAYVQNTLAISNVSTVNLSGGTLRFNAIEGINRLNYTAGTIQLAGDRRIDGRLDPASIFGSIITDGKALTIEGATKIAKTVAVFGGTLTSHGTLDIGVPIDAAFGSLHLENSGSVEVGGDVFIRAAGTSLPSLQGAGSNLSVAGSLYIALPFATFENRLLVANQARVDITGALVLAEDSHLLLHGGVLRFDGYSMAGDIDYTAGTVQLAGDRVIGSDAAISDFFGPSPTLVAGKSLVVEGTAVMQATSPLTLSGGAFSADTVVMTPGSRITNTVATKVLGTMHVWTGGVIDATAADLIVGNAAEVDGFYSNGRLLVGPNTVTLDDANDAVFDSGAVVTLGDAGSPGALAASNGLTLDFGGNITGFGVVEMPNSPAAPLINNGHIIGNSLAEPITLAGYVKGVGTFDNVSFTGSFSPGFSPARVNLGSAQYNGVLEVELGGLLPGSGYDQMNHILGAGVAQLGGTLQVSLIEDFLPSLGQSFEIIAAAGGVENTFDDVQLPSLAWGLDWNVVYGANSVRLNVVASGVSADYDNDGDVDGADFLQWQRGLSPTPASADDLAAWKAQFGNVAQMPTVASGIIRAPEPGTSLLLVVGLVGIISARRFTSRLRLASSCAQGHP